MDAAYASLGYTKKAFEDSKWEIRMEAYKSLGWTDGILGLKHIVN